MVGIHRSTMRLTAAADHRCRTPSCVPGCAGSPLSGRAGGGDGQPRMARRAGWQVNNKRIRRLWREEGLRVPQRRKKKRLTGIGVAVGAMSPIRPNVI